MPWAGRGKEESFEWTDNDDAGLRMYTEKLLGYRTEAAVKDALVQAAMIRSHNPSAGLFERTGLGRCAAAGYRVYRLFRG